jgi:hypothetical protein
MFVPRSGRIVGLPRVIGGATVWPHRKWLDADPDTRTAGSAGTGDGRRPCGRGRWLRAADSGRRDSALALLVRASVVFLVGLAPAFMLATDLIVGAAERVARRRRGGCRSTAHSTRGGVARRACESSADGMQIAAANAAVVNAAALVARGDAGAGASASRSGCDHHATGRPPAAVGVRGLRWCWSPPLRTTRCHGGRSCAAGHRRLSSRLTTATSSLRSWRIR